MWLLWVFGDVVWGVSADIGYRYYRVHPFLPCHEFELYCSRGDDFDDSEGANPSVVNFFIGWSVV